MKPTLRWASFLYCSWSSVSMAFDALGELFSKALNKVYLVAG